MAVQLWRTGEVHRLLSGDALINILATLDHESIPLAAFTDLLRARIILWASLAWW
ncbi:MAG: hypothetical protein FWH34_03795 [Desulfovibrionaceae bacterium]|nr:hypothetical protein [Desulfovibrionaceae bacterium]